VFFQLGFSHSVFLQCSLRLIVSGSGLNR
jgi:hypothetical protein